MRRTILVAALALAVLAPAAIATPGATADLATPTAVEGWAAGTARHAGDSPVGLWPMSGTFTLNGVGSGTYVGLRGYEPAPDRCGGAPYCFAVRGTVTLLLPRGSLVLRVVPEASLMQDWPSSATRLVHTLTLEVQRGTGSLGGAKGTLNWSFTTMNSASPSLCPDGCPGADPSTWLDGPPQSAPLETPVTGTLLLRR